MHSLRSLLFLLLASGLILSCETTSSEDEGGNPEEETENCGGGGEASSGPCLVIQYAGTYDVTATEGSHSRGSITLTNDGHVDYDSDLLFESSDYQGVYDRIACCMRISVEMNQRADNNTSLAPDARHRVDFFTDSDSPGGNVVSFEYYPNWPSSDGKAVLEVN